MLELYVDDATECQGDLFVEACKLYDMEFFIKFYMKSEIKRRIDINMPRYITMSGAEILEWLEKNTNLKMYRGSFKYNEDAAEWIGQWYSLCQYFSDIMSNDLIDLFPYEFIAKRYNTLHDMDIRLSVRKILEAKGLYLDKNL